MHHELTRRRFIQAGAAMSAAMALPAVSWGRVLGSNNRINMAVIGTGGMGSHHVRSLGNRTEADNVRVIQVCDVYRKRLNDNIRAIGGDENSGTMLYEEVLDNPDVDAVLIATPDHWHTKIAIEAMEAGKDVYCEKPLSLTIEQALDCRDAVHRTGRTLQVGPQYTSLDTFHQAREFINENRIGKVVWSQAAYCRNSRGGQFNWAIDPNAGPGSPKDSADYVWWDRWLGWEHDLAPKIAWNADHFFRFRKYYAYNGGVATDLLYHKLAPLLLAIEGMNGAYPSRVVASGGKYLEKDERDIADTFMMTIDYPSEHSIALFSVMTNDVGVPCTIRGQYGTMNFENGSEWGNRGKIVMNEQGTWWPEFREANADRVDHTMTTDANGNEQPEPAAGQASFEYEVKDRRDHMGNFLDAIRGDAELDCNVDLGAATMVAIKMGVEALRRDKVMLWDAEKEEAIES
ncbi:MAG: Gfo/Idh/MocA family protein [Phycisphaerales bacterium]